MVCRIGRRTRLKGGESMRLWIGLLVLLLSAQGWATVEVRDARLWRAPDNTRLVFDLSAPVEHKLFSLENPKRLVIDIPSTQLRAPLSDLPLENTPIRRLRAWEHKTGTLRIVADLKAAVHPKSFALTPNKEYGHRLVVDLFDSAADKQASEQPVVTPAPVIANVRQSALSSQRRDIVVAIDAGHGGEDPGAIGAGGEREKDLVLQIAKRLQRDLNKIKGYRAELVRTGDYFIKLRRRTEIARSKNTDLFISIHADAARRRSAHGASVYALSQRGATSETARWLANSENRSDLIGGVSKLSLDDKDSVLASVLLDLSMTAAMSSSLNVGQKVLNNIGRVTHLHKKQVEQAGFAVLKSPDIPSILIETGFISNKEESRKLHTRSHQEALVDAIVMGIRQFFRESPPPGTYIAWLRDQGRFAGDAREHVVRSGDSLRLLALRYQVSEDSIRVANNLSNDLIRVGQTLSIPVAQ